MNEPKFWDYLIFDDDCNIIGIKSDVPEDVIKEYQEWLAQQENAIQAGIK